MINEGAKILEEGKAQRASDIDIVWINGYGWPVYRGGPMFYADPIGLDKVLAKMKEFEATMGERFQAGGAAGEAGRGKEAFSGSVRAPIIHSPRGRSWTWRECCARRRCSGLVGSKGSSVTVKSNPPSGTVGAYLGRQREADGESGTTQRESRDVVNWSREKTGHWERLPLDSPA